METTNYPKNLRDYYRKNPSKFEERVNLPKRIMYCTLAAACLGLVIYTFVSLASLGDLIIGIVAALALIAFAYYAYKYCTDVYNLLSGGKVRESAIKSFRYPFYHDVGGYNPDARKRDIAKITKMFNDNNFVDLAEEQEEKSQPLELCIDEDKKGKEFYILLVYSSQGLTDVKVLKEPQYSQFYKIIKSIKST
jgi:hypothetical protein